MPKRCEDCALKVPNFGLPAEGRKRWCGGCAKAHAGVRIQGSNKRRHSAGALVTTTQAEPSAPKRRALTATHGDVAAREAEESKAPPLAAKEAAATVAKEAEERAEKAATEKAAAEADVQANGAQNYEYSSNSALPPPRARERPLSACEQAGMGVGESHD